MLQMLIKGPLQPLKKEPVTMIRFQVNEEEVALLQAFRLLTTKQRQMVLQGVIGVTSAMPQLAAIPAQVIPIRGYSAQPS